MMRACITLSLENLPEILWSLRQEMANMLRDVALQEDDERTQERLLDVAAAYEAGGQDVQWPEGES